MLRLIRGGAAAPDPRTVRRAVAPVMTGDGVGDWLHGQFASEGALGGGHARPGRLRLELVKPRKVVRHA